MKRFALLALVAAALSGCSSFSEISTDVPAYALVEGDEKPLASFVVCNVSYRLFSLFPLETGVTWKRTDFENQPWYDVAFFEDRATIDENLASVRAAMRRVKSNRVMNLETTIDDSSKWSFYLVGRRTIKTTCLILEP